MRELNINEVEEVSGGLAPLIVAFAGAVGAAVVGYVVTQAFDWLKSMIGSSKATGQATVTVGEVYLVTETLANNCKEFSVTTTQNGNIQKIEANGCAKETTPNGDWVFADYLTTTPVDY